LDHQKVAISGDIAQISESVLALPLAFDFARIGVKSASLADEIEREIGERQLLFEHRRMPAPFGKAMPVDERRVGKPERVKNEGVFAHAGRAFDQPVCFCGSSSASSSLAPCAASVTPTFPTSRPRPFSDPRGL